MPFFLSERAVAWGVHLRRQPTGHPVFLRLSWHQSSDVPWEAHIARSSGGPVAIGQIRPRRRVSKGGLGAWRIAQEVMTGPSKATLCVTYVVKIFEILACAGLPKYRTLVPRQGRSSLEAYAYRQLRAEVTASASSYTGSKTTTKNRSRHQGIRVRWGNKYQSALEVLVVPW